MKTKLEAMLKEYRDGERGPIEYHELANLLVEQGKAEFDAVHPVPDGWLKLNVAYVYEKNGVKRQAVWLDEVQSLFAAPAAQGDAIEGELTKIVKSGVETDFPGFLEWVADRLVYVHKENNNVDYVQTLRTRAKQLRAVIDAGAAS